MKNKKIKRILICISVIALSPVITSIMSSMIPSLSVAAGKIATISAGIALCETVPLETEEVTEQVVKQIFIDDSQMLSAGNPREIMPSAEDEEPAADDSHFIGPSPYPDSLENHSGKITNVRFYKSEGTQFFSLNGGGQVRNGTKLSNSKLIKESQQLPDFKIRFGSEPQVLIMHTHTTESYEPYERDFYDDSFTSRTTDESMNMVSVGNKIENELKKAGIGVIHDRTIHDYPSYNGSYERSEVTVKNILAQYPTIKVVLDVHRDAIERESGERVAPTASINGKNAAQVMIISGCDDGTMNMPNYMKNFRFACLLQQQMESDYPGLTRPVMFTYRKYNQHLTTGSILIEMGGHANSIQQAQYSGELVGKSLAEALKKIKE